MDVNKERIAVYRIGITIGLIKTEELIQWASHRMTTEKDIPKEMREIASLKPEANSLLTTKLLDKIIGSPLPVNAVKVIFSKISQQLKAGKISAVKATQLAYHAASEANMTGAEVEYLNQLDDEGYLIQLGTSTKDEKELERDIAAFLSQYDSYSR